MSRSHSGPISPSSRSLSLRAHAGLAPPVETATARGPRLRTDGTMKSQSSGLSATLTGTPAAFASSAARALQSLSVLTRELKYTYWWYGDATMKPFEELYHLTRDPLEMRNLANNSEAASMLGMMRGRYDAELERWKQQAVEYNNYQQYGRLFDRKLPWDQKKFKGQFNKGLK